MMPTASDAPLLSDAERIQIARDDFGFFLSWVHETDAREIFDGKAVPAAHHQEMIDLLTEETKHSLIVAPRGSAKTTIVQSWVEWELGRASLGHKGWVMDHRVLWFSNTAHQAYRASNAIKATIEFNRIYQAIFPKVKPHRDKWSQEEWKVKGNNSKDANFLALGVQGPALGARGLVVIYDDIADQDNMKTPRGREELIEWLNTTANPILVPWGRFVMACTRWAWDDPADWAEKRGWKTLATHPMKALIEEESDGPARRGIARTARDDPGAGRGPPALTGGGLPASGAVASGGRMDETADVSEGSAPAHGAHEAGVAGDDGRDPSTGGNEGPGLGTAGSDAHAVARTTSDSAATYRSYWPERFTVSFLLALRAEDPRAFAKTHQNEVAPEEGLAFLREWFQPRFDYLPNEVLFKANSWDTAASDKGRKRSFSAGWSAVVTPDFHIYLYNLNRGQVLYPYLRQAVYMQAQQDHSDYVIIEAKSSGKQLLDEFNIAFLQRKIPWRVVEWQPAGQRGSVTRFQYNEEVTDYCEKGRVHLPSEFFLRHQPGIGLWLGDAEQEIFSYPSGQNDDIVDAMCQLIYYVRQREQMAQRYADPPKPTPWADSWTGGKERALV